MREWCSSHREKIEAMRNELNNLRQFVRSNVLNGDEAARVLRQLEKFGAACSLVDESSEQVIRTYEAESARRETVVSYEPSSQQVDPGTPPDTVEGSAPA